MTKSIWAEQIHMPAREALHSSVSTDVAVIGGGMAGILTARLLCERGISCIVLEQGRIGGGTTQNTTAKITAQHGLKYRYLIDKFGEQQAGQYADAAVRALREYDRMIQQYRIFCGFERLPSFLYSRKETKRLEEERDAAAKLRLQMDMTCAALPFSTAGALMLRDQAQFQPLAFLKSIADGLTIYENTPVRAVENGSVFTDDACVSASQVVVATHFPIINAPGYYFIRMHQERSCVLALSGAPLPDGMYYGIENGEWSLRSYNELLLFGGESYRTGENTEGGRYASLRRAAKEWFPAAKEVAHWSAQDCMTLDGVPYIGCYSPALPGVYVATGFGKWGMTGAMVSALCLAELLSGKTHPYPLFSPQRFRLSSDLTALLSQSVQTIRGFSAGVFSFPKENAEALAPDSAAVVDYQGRKLGVYKAPDGELFTVSARCTHLGCQLEWNPDEHTWDCPCHGSRFDIHGQLVENPATAPLPCDHTP